MDQTYTSGAADESAGDAHAGPPIGGPVGLRRGRRPRLRKFLVGFAASLAFVCFLALAAAAVFWARLDSGPIYFEGLGPRIASALEDRIGNGFTVEVGPTIVGKGQSGPTLGIDGFRVRSAFGQTILSAPRAQIAVDAFGLMFGHIRPAGLDLIGLDVRLVVLPNGSFAIAAGSDPIVLTGPAVASAPAAPVAETTEPPATEASASTPPPSASPAEVRALIEGLRSLLNIATSPEGPAAALEKVELSAGRLVLDDQLSGRQTVFDNLDLEFGRSGDTARLALATNGVAGRWRATAVTTGTTGGPRDLSISLDDVALDDIVALAGQRIAPVDFDMPISLRFRLNLGADGALLDANTRFQLGAGYLYFRDRDMEPVLIDEVSGGAYWNPVQKRLVIDQFTVESEGTHLNLAGVASPLPDEEAWSVSLSSTDSHIGADRPGDKPIGLSKLAIDAKFRSAQKMVDLQRLDASGPDLSLAFTGAFGWGDSGPRFQLNGKAGQMEARNLIRLWPSFVAASARGWFIDNLVSGTVEDGSVSIDFDADALAQIQAGRPAPDHATLVEFRLRDTTASFLKGVPPLSGVEGLGKITGRTASFHASKGQLAIGPNKRLVLHEASFVVPDLDPAVAISKLQAHATGPLDVVADILSRDALKEFGGLPIDAKSARGQVEGRITVDLHMNQETNPGDPRVRVAANVTNFTLEKVVGNEKLDQGNITVTVDRSTFRATGQGRLFGAPATLDIRRDAKGITESTISATLDDAARTKQGWPTGNTITGIVGAKFSTDLARGDEAKPQVELDFTRAGIDGLVPGYSKPAGKPAKASFQVASRGDGAELEQFSFDGGGGTMAAGTLSLDQNGNFTGGKFSQVRLSPGDDMKVDVEQTRDGLKLVVRAAVLDARPFTRKVSNPEPGSAREGGTPKGIDLDLRANLLTGANRQTISNAEVRYVGRGSAISQFQVKGRLGNAPLGGQLIPGQTPGTTAIAVTTTDGGALLSFIDLYRRMEGGNMTLSGQVRDGTIDGYIHVLDFQVRDEPGLRRLVTEGVQQRDPTTGRSINTSAVQFTKLQAFFSRTPTRLDLKDAVIYGPDIGLMADGSIDYGRDRVAITGTFVPAYGLNNLFARIPLVGLIIGGGTNEGLFAVNFNIGGKASAPVLNINPLSAIAPGIFRKIFGAGAPQAPAQPTPPAAVQPRASPQMPLSISPAR